MGLPSTFSIRSTNTSMGCPTDNSSKLRNSLAGMIPSAFAPISTATSLGRISEIVPVTIVFCFKRLSEFASSKLSIIAVIIISLSFFHQGKMLDKRVKG